MDKNKNNKQYVFFSTLIALLAEAIAGTIGNWNTPVLFGVLLPTLGVGMFIFGFLDWYRPTKWTCWILGVLAFVWGLVLLFGPDSLKTLTVVPFIVANLFGGNGSNGPWWKNIRLPRKSMATDPVPTNTRGAQSGLPIHRYLWWFVGFLVLVIIVIAIVSPQ